MILDLTACFVFLAAIVAGIVILWRKLRIAGEAAAGELVCVACRTPARLLSPDSFVCPTCHQDVRLLGIALDRPKGLTRPFWQVMIFSAALCGIAMVTSGVFSSERRVNYVSMKYNLQFVDEAYQSVAVAINGWREGDGPLHGELYADLFLKDGQAVTLVIDSPSRRYRLIDSDGHESLSGESFGQDAAVRWLSMAGLDSADPVVRKEAGWMRARIEDYLKGNDNVPIVLLDERPHYMGGGGGGSSDSRGRVETHMSYLVIGWSLVWLAGLIFILRPRVAAPRAQKEAAA